MSNKFAYTKNGDTSNLYLTPYEPVYGIGSRQRDFAEENPNIQDISSKQWYRCSNGVELIDNGKFDIDLSGWTTAGTPTVSNGVVTLDSEGESISQNIETIVGNKYKIEFDTIVGGSTWYLRLYIDGILLKYFVQGTTGRQSLIFVSSNPITNIQFASDYLTSATIDNVSVFEAEFEKDTLLSPQITYQPYTIDMENGKPGNIDRIDLPTFIEESILARHIHTTEDSVVKEVGTIYSGKRYVFKHTDFFSNYTGNPLDYTCLLEIQYNGKWYGIGGWVYISATIGAMVHSQEEGIVLRVAGDRLTYGGSTADGNGGIEVALTSAPARIRVIYTGRTKNV